MSPRASARKQQPPSSSPTAISSSSSQSPTSILSALANQYSTTTPSRTKLIDAFLAFLVVAGVLQFVYCVVAGNYVCRPPPLSPSSGWLGGLLESGMCVC